MDWDNSHRDGGGGSLVDKGQQAKLEPNRANCPGAKL